MNAEDCSICIDPLSDMPVVELECNHPFHLQCMRKLLRHATNNPPDYDEESKYACPMCRCLVSPEMVDDLTHESRNLCFSYLLSRSTSERLQAKVRAVARVGSRRVESQAYKVEDLPVHHNSHPQRVLIADFELSVEDPRQKFQVWVEDVETRSRISRHYYLATIAIDHLSETEEEEEETMEQQEEPPMLSEEQPENSRRRRRRVMNPVTSERQRQRARLERRAISRSTQITAARRALERSQAVTARRQDQLQDAYERFNEAMNEFIDFTFSSRR